MQNEVLASAFPGEEPLPPCTPPAPSPAASWQLEKYQGKKAEIGQKAPATPGSLSAGDITGPSGWDEWSPARSHWGGTRAHGWLCTRLCTQGPRVSLRWQWLLLCVCVRVCACVCGTVCTCVCALHAVYMLCTCCVHVCAHACQHTAGAAGGRCSHGVCHLSVEFGICRPGQLPPKGGDQSAGYWMDLWALYAGGSMQS